VIDICIENARTVIAQRAPAGVGESQVIAARQRKPSLYFGAICILLLAVAFGFLGVYTNPSIQQLVGKAMGTTPKSQTEYGMKQFQYPINSTVTITVKIACEVLGNDLSVGKSVWLLSNVTVSGNPYFTVWDVYLQPANVVESPYGATIIGFNGPSVDSGEQTAWFGSGLVIFETAGPLVATVTLSLYPTSATKWTSIDIPFYTDIPEISIAPSATDMFHQDQSLSLTFFVLFFVTLNVAVIVHDHSYGSELAPPRFKPKH
jgi:hypothetical protein